MDIIVHVRFLVVKKNTLRDWLKDTKKPKILPEKIENPFLIKLLNNKLIKS